VSHTEATDLQAAASEAEAGRRVVVSFDGKRLAVMPAEDLARLEAYEAEEEDRALAEEARASVVEFSASGESGKPVEELRREFGLDCEG